MEKICTKRAVIIPVRAADPLCARSDVGVLWDPARRSRAESTTAKPRGESRLQTCAVSRRQVSYFQWLEAHTTSLMQPGESAVGRRFGAGQPRIGAEMAIIPPTKQWLEPDRYFRCVPPVCRAWRLFFFFFFFSPSLEFPSSHSWEIIRYPVPVDGLRFAFCSGMQSLPNHQCSHSWNVASEHHRIVAFFPSS